MNVVFTVRGKEVVSSLREAKRILNNLYEHCDQVYINGERTDIDQYDREDIIKQLHGEIYV